MWRLVCLLMILAMPANAGACEDLTFDGASFTACKVDLTTQQLELFHSSVDGQLFGTFRAVDAQLAEDGQTL